MTVGSLYAGVGGICLGFENAGFNISWANEYDKNACITYRSNFKHKLIERDVMELDISSLGKVEVLVGGFPCQPFSIAGKQKGFNDKRGNHFFRMLHFADAMRPKVLFFENVKHLVTHDNGNTFATITNELIKRNYEVYTKILNTKEYGNIPQNRERIFIVGFDRNHDKKAHSTFEFPMPQKLTKSIKDCIISDKVAERFYYREDKSMYKILQREILKEDTIYQFRRNYVRENKSKLCPTLTASMGTGGHNVPLIKTQNGIRKLTPKECFAFQGFPDSFKLPDIAISHLYKQAGNTVSVPVIEKIAIHIRLAIDK